MTTTKTMVSAKRRRSARLAARVSSAQKELFQKAAALEGRTLTDFVVNSVSQAAKRIVEDSETIRLGTRDREVFVRELLHPGAPNKALKAAAAWYKKRSER